MENSALPPQLSRESVGQFDAQEWVSEGDQLLASAKMMRIGWLVGMKRRLAASDRQIDRIWTMFEGPPKACILLLGYAVEMYLKAALTKAYYGCSEEMFDRDVRKRFGHELGEMAREIGFSVSTKDLADLRILKEMIVHGARYPIRERAPGSYTRQQAERLWQSINRPEFTRLRILAIRIRKHALKIDMDGYDPAYFARRRIDSDGYVAFRSGGRLAPRISYRLSTEQRASGETSLKHVRDIVEEKIMVYPLLMWNYSLIQEDRLLPDGTSRTVVVQHPASPAPKMEDLLRDMSGDGERTQRPT
jgi:hypothetical protein